MTIYFENCPACRNGIIEVSADARFGEMIDACRAKWGEGTLIRTRSEYVWRHDPDAKWIGCCAEKVYGKDKDHV